MDPSSIWQIITIIILLAFSAFFSSAETALTTVNKHRIRALADKGDPRAKRVLYLKKRQSKILGTILIGNNIVNLSASSLTTTLTIDLAKQLNIGSNTSTFIGIGTGLLTFLILIFGEITPKNIATRQNLRISLLYSGPIYVLTILFTPVVFIVNAICSALCRCFGIRDNSSSPMTELELRTIVDVSQEEGVIEPEEQTLIHNVVDFGDSIARDIMIPRIDIEFACVDMDYEQLTRIFIEEQYSRLPVYDTSKDNVIGILYLKDLFFYHERHKDQAFDIYKVLRKPFFTYEYQKTSVLMEEMRSRSISFCIVLDEYGCTAGLITLEDLIEEIIGEIRDEYDEAEKEAIHQVEDHAYEVSGSMKLDDLNEALGTGIFSEDYDSIGGHMIELLDHIPEEGETVREGDYLYSIKKMNHNRIETVYIKIEDSES